MSNEQEKKDSKELTVEEKKWICELLGNVNISVTNPHAPRITALAKSIIEKIGVKQIPNVPVDRTIEKKIARAMGRK